ncbi:hypothetical protein HY333_01835 [Candidatus Collierbacteria bacterium]|nr:hypothetical protein [Candidatus Collierbacteria bacterium]
MTKLNQFHRLINFLDRHAVFSTIAILLPISVLSFVYFYLNGLGLSYNDARSHLDIGRRVVEGLKPGLAQLGSVWLPLPHILMIPTVWNDFMWHSGLAGAIQSMIAFIGLCVVIYLILRRLNISPLISFLGVSVFVLNLNVLYLQSTAMTEMIFMFFMLLSVLELLVWFDKRKILNLIRASFWVMLSTLVRYDGWFLFIYVLILIGLYLWSRFNYRVSEGMVILFSTLAGFGIFLWFLWNLLIFKDPLYFIFGPFSARSQQQLLEQAGDLDTKGNLLFSTQIYTYSMIYNSGAFAVLLGTIGAILFFTDRRIKPSIRLAISTLLTPYIFNILALYLGHSVLYIQGLSGDTWFNVRYGLMMLPSLSIFIAYLISKIKNLGFLLYSLWMFVTIFSFINADAVTIEDALVGSSQKNVTEVSQYLKENATDRDEFILISVASHDAIIFSSNLPMRRFIHEGTGEFWKSAIENPDRWVRWIIMRTNDDTDLTFRSIKDSPSFTKFYLVASYPFADVYQLKPEFLSYLNSVQKLDH